MMQKWSSEMQRAIQLEERRREARERTKMEQEDSNQLPKTTDMGENTGTEDSRPNAAPRARCTGLLSGASLVSEFASANAEGCMSLVNT